jgi:hypothetical protein
LSETQHSERIRQSRGGSGFANARFETDIEEGLDVLEEYYPEQERSFLVEQQASHEGVVQDIQQGLQQSIRAVN